LLRHSGATRERRTRNLEIIGDVGIALTQIEIPGSIACDRPGMTVEHEIVPK